jgi:hypothetical protein
MLTTKDITISRLWERLSPNFELGVLTYLPIGVNWWDCRFADKPAFNTLCHGYLVGSIDKTKLLKHRVLLAMYLGYWPEEVDHINKDKLDNRVSNLREVSRLDNQRNLPKMKSNSSGSTGVSYHKRDKVWRSYIGDGTKTVHLGNFKSFEDALNKRKEMEYCLGYN